MRTPDALRLLWRLKVRGAIRRQWRKLRTVKGMLLTLIGVLLFVLWIGQAAFALSRRGESDPETLFQRVGLGALLISSLSVFGALAHRGLFIPKDEIERLLAAPLSRADLVRYRLRANAMRSLFGGVIVGAMVMMRMPRPLFAFLGVMLGMQTLPVIHQLIAIVLGRLETRFAKRLAFVSKVLFPVALGCVIFAAIGTGGGRAVTRALERVFGGFDGQSLLDHPMVTSITRPFYPWTAMITAPTLEVFALWFAVCTAILLVVVECTVRIPVDFRELSLATSAHVASRIRRARRGGGAAAGRVSKRMVGWRVPWIFGRGPARAVAWRKAGSIVRKARGTFIVSILVLAFVTFLARTVGEDTPAWFGSVMIGTFGTLYLCAGLRFDFRDELDRMEVIKAWPVRASRLFLAMLAPEACLVSALLVGAMLLSAIASGRGVHPVTWGVAACVPPVVLAWVALDNAVFLFAPVRFVPGQDGALQNAGRGVVLLLLRALILAVVGGVGAAAFAGVYFGLVRLGNADESIALLAGFASLAAVLFVLDAVLVAIGGAVLVRFDVARDRG